MDWSESPTTVSSPDGRGLSAPEVPGPPMSLGDAWRAAQGRDPDILAEAARGLADAVHRGALGRLTVQKADGEQLLGSDHPLTRALEGAGFVATPRGLRLRRRPRA